MKRIAVRRVSFTPLTNVDKPWVTDWFRDLVRKRQRAHMSGDLNQAKILRNKVNRAASKLKYN